MVILNMSKMGQPLKTATTAHIAEYCQTLNGNTICITLDTLHNTFSRYKKLNVQNGFIDDGFVNLDKLINFIINNKDSHIIIDCGVSIFDSMVNYLVKHDITSLFQSKNIDLFLVSIIEGGVNTLECIQDFYTLSKIPHVNLVVIDDERMGPTRIENKEFFETRAYISAVDNGAVRGEIHFTMLYKHHKPYLLKMLRMKLLFSELENNDSDFNPRGKLFTVYELQKVKRYLWSNFDQAFSKDSNTKTTLKKARDGKNVWFAMVKHHNGDETEHSI